jgi:pyridoxamine 5'-phosphate oxidase
MINFININNDEPYLKLKNFYDQAIGAKQQNIEAISVSSYSRDLQEVSSRFVNLKLIDNNKFIFFSNYNSPKSKDFLEHKQVSILIFWANINLQIRLKAVIEKTSQSFNTDYFRNRSIEKNALAISSDQSATIESFDIVKNNYNKCLANEDLKKCPDHWGGFSFTPYYFEFWKGDKNRLNEREAFTLLNNEWLKSILQP